MGGGGGGGMGLKNFLYLFSPGRAVIPKNLYKYKLGKIIMIGICIGISYGK